MKAIPRFLGVVTVLTVLAAGSASAQSRVPRGQLYHDGSILRTLVPPSAMPHEGRDTLYKVMGGVSGQLGVIAVAPGDRGYHGGQWAVYHAVWNMNVTPYLLTSDEEVLAAETAGDLTITRVPEEDFKCPVQP